MLDLEKVRKVWKQANESERYGFAFGLFPVWVLDCKLTKQEEVHLMRIATELYLGEIV